LKDLRNLLRVMIRFAAQGSLGFTLSAEKAPKNIQPPGKPFSP